MSASRYLICHHVLDGEAVTLAKRMNARAELMPPGLRSIDIWASRDREMCWQLIESDDPNLFERWSAQWRDSDQIEVTELMAGRSLRGF